jgi:hypothetical protein
MPVSRRVTKTFAPEGQTVKYKRGQIISVDESQARELDNQGLTEAVAARPSKAAAGASAADNKARAARAAETKETTGKDASGLESWDGAMSEESYVAKYDGSDSPTVVEKLKLAKARIKAGVSQGAGA